MIHTLSTHLHHCPQSTPNTTVKLNSTNTQTKHQTNTKACVFVYTPLQRKGDVQKYCMYFTVLFMASCEACIAMLTQDQSQTSGKCTRHVHPCHHNHENENYPQLQQSCKNTQNPVRQEITKGTKSNR